MTDPKPLLMWISDACAPTGFARVTHNLLGWLGSKWDRMVIGVNYKGDPHGYPYPIYPAIVGGDLWGFNRFVKLVREHAPDVVLIQSDTWIVQGFLDVAAKMEASGDDLPPIVGWMPVDAVGMKRSTAAEISKLARAIFYTRFGEVQAEAAGFQGKSAAIGLGVRREIYYPRDKAAARRRILPNLPPDAFLVGNINRNQPRKRIDLTIKYFAEWLRRGGDGYLYLHALNEDTGWDLIELAHWYGIADRMFMPSAKTFDDLFHESAMPDVYSMLDLQVSTTLGEGFGLPTLEGMSCRVPQLVPEWAALGEWARGGVRYVPAEPGEASWGHKAFGIGAVANLEAFVAALEELRHDPKKLDALAEAGKTLADEQDFGWEQVARRIHQELGAVIEEEGESDERIGESDGSTIHGCGRGSSDAAM